ncbi:hypothetical protein BKA65DRAFT_268437 [Rhexocercosporidium sp. MPI-PUGE-AT-0058]|nr:hypothetical protein BKA65DRAFT_268437 [Rhexocercosporidium sp. MPI-PUGE-AT-0058]
MAVLSIFFIIVGVIVFFLGLSGFIGWLKARKNQARYGPRPAIAGRPRQTRGRGLALAVLESIPIVKFGASKHPDTIPKDIELEEAAIDSDRDTTVAADRALDDSRGDLTKRMTPSANIKSVPEAETIPRIVAQVHSNEKECSICISDFSNDEEVRVLPCNHRFHPECIDPWLLNISGTCPICRYDLHPNDPTDSQTVEPPPAGVFRPELSPIGYVRDQALRDGAARVQIYGFYAPGHAAQANLPIPSPSLPHPRDRNSILSRLREIRQAHSGQEYIAALGRLYSDREHRRPSLESRGTRSSSTPAGVVTQETRSL